MGVAKVLEENHSAFLLSPEITFYLMTPSPVDLRGGSVQKNQHYPGALYLASGVKLELTGGRNGDLLYFRMKAGSVLVLVTVLRWLEGRYVSTCNHLVCSRDILDLHLKLCSGD